MKYYAISEEEAKRLGADLSVKSPLLIWADFECAIDTLGYHLENSVGTSDRVEEYLNKVHNADDTYELKQATMDRFFEHMRDYVNRCDFGCMYEILDDITYEFTKKLEVKDFVKNNLFE